MHLYELEDEPTADVGSAPAGDAGGGESATSGAGGSESATSGSDSETSGGEAASDAGASSTPPSVTSSPTSGVAAPPETPWYDDFGWEEWDGDLMTFPEEHRTMAHKFHGYYQPRVKAAEDSFNSLQTVYDAMLQGQEDPRVGTLTSERDKWRGDHEKLTSDFATYKERVQKQADDEARDWVTAFNARHADILKDKTSKKGILDLINQDWDPELAVQLFSQPKEVIEAATALWKQGVPQHHAVRFSLLETQGSGTPPVERPAPRSSAQVTSGAEGDSKAGTPAPIDPMQSANSMDDIRNIAVKRALKGSSRRK